MTNEDRQSAILHDMWTGCGRTPTQCLVGGIGRLIRLRAGSTKPDALIAHEACQIEARALLAVLCGTAEDEAVAQARANWFGFCERQAIAKFRCPGGWYVTPRMFWPAMRQEIYSNLHYADFNGRQSAVIAAAGYDIPPFRGNDALPSSEE